MVISKYICTPGMPLIRRCLLAFVSLCLALGLAQTATAADAQLTVADGVVVKFGAGANAQKPGSGLWVRGQLRTGSGVVFTSEHDSTAGTSVRSNSSSTPAAADWLGVFLSDEVKPANISINGLTLRYAGGTQNVPPALANAGAALNLKGGSFVFSDLRLERSPVGLWVTGQGSPQIQSSRIVGNGIGLRSSLMATPTITQSSLAENTSYGVLNDSPQSVVQAANNWWGHPTGPRDSVGNPSGQGSRVSTGVAYQPYLTLDPSGKPGPTMTLSFAGQALSAGATLRNAGELVLSAYSAKGVTQLEAYVDGVPVAGGSYGASPAPSTEASPVEARGVVRFENLSNGAHTIAAIARDPEGGITTINVPFTLDMQRPGAAAITSPLNGATVTSSFLNFAGTAEPWSNVQVTLNGQVIGQLYAADGSGNFAGSVQLPAEGAYSLQARAVNARGDGPFSAAVAVSYVLPPPTVTFLSPSDQAIVRGVVNVQVSAIDVSGISQVQIQADTAAGPVVLGTLNSAPWMVVWNTGALPDGNYTLTATATSVSGKSAQARRVVQVQQVPPPPPAPVMPYGTRALNVTPALSFGEQPIIITGQVATTDSSAQSVPNASLKLVLRVQGFERRITLVSDASGQFSYSFVPQSNDAGTYSVYVVHPDDSTYASRPAAGQFTINRLSFNYSQYKLNAIRGQATPVQLQVRASAGTGAKAVRWVAQAADQPSGSLPPGITLDLGQPIDVAAGTAVPMTLTLKGSEAAGATGTIILKAFAQESGTTPRAELRLDYQLHEATPGLSPSPSLVEIGVKQGESASGVVTVTNKGLAAAQAVKATLLTSAGGTPPNWVRLASSSDIGNLDIGQSTSLQIVASPGAEISDGYYQYELRINAENDAGGKVPVTIAVAQSGEGGVRFKLVDIYTNTLDKNGQLIPGLAGATIKLQNEALTADIRSLTSNEQGIAEATNLAPGNYRWRVSAPGHTDAGGRVQVRAGLTASERVFLDSQLISVEFSVTETTIKDEYHITLEATYQTQVPAPVVLMEPASINLPDMQVGEEITGEITVSNYGLVRADDLQFTLPKTDQNYRYEFFGEMPKELAAKSRVVIPYRITAIAPIKSGVVLNDTTKLLPLATGYSPSIQVQQAIRNLLTTGKSAAVPREKADAVAKAASCSSYGASACVNFKFTCAAGDTGTASFCVNISRLFGGSCTAPSGGGTGSGGTGGGGPGGWGGGGPGGAGGSLFTFITKCPPGGCSRCAGGGAGPGSGPGPGGPGPGPGGPGPGGPGPGGPGPGGPGPGGPGPGGPGPGPGGCTGAWCGFKPGYGPYGPYGDPPASPPKSPGNPNPAPEPPPSDLDNNQKPDSNDGPFGRCR